MELINIRKAVRANLKVSKPVKENFFDYPHIFF